MNPFIEKINQSIVPYRAQLLEHPLYQQMNSLEDLQTFMEYHVFAVWDFMSLAKALQIQLTCVEIPWTPVGNPKVRRFINEIILGEESDEDENGVPMSHFEMYLEAMQALGANTSKIELLIRYIETGKYHFEAIQKMRIHSAIKHFLTFTFDTIEAGNLAEIAAAFTFGREDLIPMLFTQIVNQISEAHPEKLKKFKYYLERHIELDGDSHGHLAMLMLEEICGNDEEKWGRAEVAAMEALTLRVALWDGILAGLPERVAN